MKKRLALSLIILVFHYITNLFAQPEKKTHIDLRYDHRNFYLVAWNGDWRDHLAYARQMGHTHVYYRPGMEKDPNAKDMRFYLGSPEYHCYSRDIDTRREYTEEETDSISRFVALKDSTAPFPDNLARAWFRQPQVFCVEPDYQQQRVIDLIVEKTLKRIEEIEKNDLNFRFAGYMFDVPQLTGDFWDTLQTRNTGRQITLAYWTGRDCGSRHPDVMHNFPTYSDGKAAYYQQLFERTRERYPDLKVFMEPYSVYTGFIKPIEDRPDFKELMPDILAQEKGGTEFITDHRIYQSGLVQREDVMSTTPDVFSESESRKIAGLSAANGHYFGWYGRWGGSGDMPNYQNIWEVPPRLLLVRAIPTWENLLQTPLEKRRWDEESYSSPTSSISRDVIVGTQPGTNKIFLVFNDPGGVASLPEGAGKGLRIYRTNGLFIEEGGPVDDLAITDGKITLKYRYAAGRGYILK